MAQETRELNQKAVLWRFIGYNDYGDPITDFYNPIEIPVHWEVKRKESKKPDGTTVSIVAEVIVDRKIYPGSLMWRGCMEDWVGTGTSNVRNEELLRVAAYEEVADLKGREFQRSVSLEKYKDPPIPVD